MEKGKRKSKKKMLQVTRDGLGANVGASNEYHSPMDSGEDEEGTWVDSSPSLEMANLDVVTEPVTPVKPLSKKTKRDNAVSADAMANGNTTSESVDILAAIRELSVMHDATFQKISTIEKTTEATSKEIDNLAATVKQLVVDVGENKKELHRLQSEVHAVKMENSALKATVDESRRYRWKWFLKLHGLKESDGENVRNRVLDILQHVAPDVSDSLHAGVDIAHRLGPQQAEKKRAIIILFTARRVRDAVWHAARKSKHLRDKQLTITEPLSPEDRAARDRLWPLVKKAREEGKRASFRNSYALIDGKKYDFSEVK